MQILIRISLMICVALAWSSANAQQTDLPRVLIIGDSIYNQTSRSVASSLKGKANVVLARWPSNTVANSSTALEHFDHLLGRIDGKGQLLPEDQWPTWDLIHINVGLGDLVHRIPNLKTFRVLPIDAGGVVATPPNQFEINLNELITRLKSTQAQIVWASITPIRHSRSNLFELGSEIEYNKIAQRVMSQHNVPTNDMFAYAVSIMNMDKPASHGADPFNFDKKPIHGPVVEAIANPLKIKLEPQTKARN